MTATWPGGSRIYWPGDIMILDEEVNIRFEGPHASDYLKAFELVEDQDGDGDKRPN